MVRFAEHHFCSECKESFRTHKQLVKHTGHKHKLVRLMVNANLTPFEREHDVNHQYSQCEKDGCDNPKNNKRHCTKHMYLD